MSQNGVYLMAANGRKPEKRCRACWYKVLHAGQGNAQAAADKISKLYGLRMQEKGRYAQLIVMPIEQDYRLHFINRISE